MVTLAGGGLPTVHVGWTLGLVHLTWASDWMNLPHLHFFPANKVLLLAVTDD